MDKDMVKKLLRSVLQGSKDGVAEHDLNKEFKMLTGDNVPYRSLGFPRLEDMMVTFSDTVKIERRGNMHIFHAIADSSTVHIQRMVASQKSNKRKSKKSLRRPVGKPSYGRPTVRRAPSSYRPAPPSSYYRPSPAPYRPPPPSNYPNPNYPNPNYPTPFRPVPNFPTSSFQAPVRAAPSNANPRRLNTASPAFTAAIRATRGWREVREPEPGRLVVHVRSEKENNSRFSSTNGYHSNSAQNLAPRFHKLQINDSNSSDNSSTAPPTKPWTSEREYQVKRRVKQILDGNPRGIWLSKLPELYQNEFHDVLSEPINDKLDSWKDIMSHEVFGSRKMILFPAKDESDQTVTPVVLSIPDAELPSLRSKVDIYLSHVLDCTQFCVQRHDGNTLNLMKLADDYYQKGPGQNLKVTLSQLKVNTFCAALYDGQWYRAQIVNISQNDGKAEIGLYYIDYGNSEVQTVDTIRSLTSELCKYPKQAIPCRLHNVQEKDTEGWIKANDRFQTLLASEEVLSIETLDIIAGVASVKLFRKTSSLSFNEMLVNKDLVAPSEIRPAEEPAALELPQEKDWDIIVSFIKSSQYIVVRLVGESYCDALRELEELIATNSRSRKHLRNTNFVVGTLCAAHIPSEGEDSGDNPYYRARIRQIKDEVAQVELLDYGDHEDVPLEKLRLLSYQENLLPYQAVPVSLAGLEHCTDEHVTEYLIENANGNMFVAEVESRDVNISITLWDTSKDDDVNFNEKLILLLNVSSLVPALPKVFDTTEAYVSHISESGQIFIQIPGPGYNTLRHLSYETSEKLNQAKATLFVRNPQPGMLCLALYTDSLWYRASILELLPGRRVLVNFVDYGNIEVVPFIGLRDLADTNKQLYRLPYQALEVELERVPPEDCKWTTAALERLADLAPPDLLINVEVILAACHSHQSGEQEAAAVVEIFYYNEAMEMTSIKEQLLNDKQLWDTEQAETQEEPAAKVYDNNANLAAAAAATKSESTSSALVSNLPKIDANCADIYITFASSPSDFRFVLYEYIPALRTLNREIQEFYNNKENHKRVREAIKMGHAYAVKNDDEFWYRAVVTQLPEGKGDSAGAMEPTEVVVKFVDYGDHNIVSRNDVVQLEPQFKEFPWQAFNAKLAGIEPEQDSWSSAAVEFFEELVWEKRMTVWLHGEPDGPTAARPVTLVREQCPKGEESFVHKILLQKGMAKSSFT